LAHRKSALKVHGSELPAELSTTLRVSSFKQGFSATPATGLISHEWGLQRTKMALMKLDETIESWSGSRYARLEVMQADVQKSTQMQHQLQRGDEHVNFM
jgi:hypothetical protein